MIRTVLITGCSSGFGKAAALLFAANGWNVAATMRNTADAGELAGLDNIAVLRLDVEDTASIDSAVAASIARFGRVDALVNNAGYGLMTIFEAASRDAVRRQFDVNLFGAMDVTRALLPHFRANKGGSIINMSSGTGIFGAPMASVYSASKFALEGWSEALAYELASLNITVKLIEPGGAPETGFIARSGAEAASAAVPADYQPFITAIMQVYASMGSSADADAVDKVVAAIFAAATDGTPRLRYQPTDDITPIVNARRSTSEDEYQALVRGFFTPIIKKGLSK
jgi:NAD(P)-dependent dehydrogenase (short-subunit alcohol dehydrogenase family)